MLVYDETVTTRQFTQSTKEWLDKAESRPISVQRPGGNAITMVSREKWADATQAQEWLNQLAAIAAYALARTRGDNDRPPTNLSWLSAYDPSELCEFIEELAASVQTACSGARSFADVANTVKEWHHSALILLDKQMMERLENEAREFRK